MPELSGAYLKQIREEKQIPLEKVAAETKIRLSILQDIEDEEYSELSSSTQVKGFLRIYANYLAIELDKQADPSVLKIESANTISKKQKIPEIKPEIAQNSILKNEPVANNVEASSGLASDQSLSFEEQSIQLDDQTFLRLSQKRIPESKQMLESIGRQLAARRRNLNLHWDLISAQIHISKAQLQSIEKGDIEAFSNSMQYKGALQNYAHFLNLDTESLMIRFADALQQRRNEAQKQKRNKSKSPKVLSPFFVNLKRFFTLDLFFGTLLILGIVGFLIWGISNMSESFLEETQPTQTLPAVADVLLSTPEVAENIMPFPTATQISPPTYPTSTPFYSSTESEAALEVIILARQNIWLRVTADSKPAYSGRIEAGNVINFSAEEEIVVETGNVVGMEIIFNQETLNPLSDQLGTALRLLFTLDGFSSFSISDAQIEMTPTSQSTTQPTDAP